jgi:hypothetical protein
VSFFLLQRSTCYKNNYFIQAGKIVISRYLLPLLCTTNFLFGDTLPEDSLICGEDFVFLDGASSNSTTICAEGPRSIWLDVRHIENKGIGYNTGYTTIETFFAPPQGSYFVLPFVDLRGHVFNDGKFAANAGIGFRALHQCRTYGFNAYYDYRNTHRYHYNQIGAGFETLGAFLDVRINGYLPVGRKLSRGYHTEFWGFKGNRIYLSQKFEFAMKGVDAEAGFHFGKSNYIDFYAAVGPYVFAGPIGNTAYGGKVRFRGMITDYLTLEISDSFDNVFHNNVQGQISINIPLGKSPNVKRNYGNCSNCDDAIAMSQRMVQPVDRAEIVVVDTHRKKRTANDPLTGQPYVIWFVNNTSHSSGTFESPFSSIATAENIAGPYDIIYVFPGDGTTSGMNTGITLKDYQKLFGAGTNQILVTTLGTFTIPAMANSMPKITNSANGIINCSNHNEISGFNIIIDSILNGIICSNISDVSIHNNLIDGTSASVGSASGLISLANSDNINIFDNTIFIGADSPLANNLYGINFSSVFPGANYLIKNNVIQSPFNNGSTGIAFGPNSDVGNYHQITISNNQFINLGSSNLGQGNAIYGNFNGTEGYFFLDKNTFSHNDSINGEAIVYLNQDLVGPAEQSYMLITVTNNVWVLSPNTIIPSLSVGSTNGNMQTCLTLINNQSDNTGSGFSAAYQLNGANSGGAGGMTANVTGNIGSVRRTVGVNPGVCPCPCQCTCP